MKLVITLAALTLALSGAPGWAEGLGVGPNGDIVVIPPRTPKELELGLEGRPPGAVEQPSPDDSDLLIDEPDENLDDPRLPPTPPLSPSRP